uniref:Uncharacterized protein n=1 Tax=Leersia perrieri TaxID=77586 RepID=A0A0D9XWE3_9ORYZ
MAALEDSDKSNSGREAAVFRARGGIDEDSDQEAGEGGGGRDARSCSTAPWFLPATGRYCSEASSR